MHIRRIEEMEFVNMNEKWNLVLKKSASDNIFLTWEWLHTWWNHFKGNDKELAVFVAEDDNKDLIAIFPFYIVRGKIFPRNGVLHFLGDKHVGSDYLDFIIAHDFEERVIPQLFQLIVKNNISITSFCFRDMNSLSPNIPHVLDSLKKFRLSYLVEPGEKCPYLPLESDTEKFLKGLSGNLRSSLKKRFKKLDENFSVRLIKTDNSENIVEDIYTLFNLHKLRRESIREDGAFYNDKSIKFHLNIGNQFLRAGWLHLYFLLLNDEYVASIYCFGYCGKMYYYQAGFDPKYEEWSVGLVIMGKCIEEAISRELSEFDFLRGDEPYKKRWTKLYRDTNHITAFQNNMFGDLYYHNKKILMKISDIRKKTIKLCSVEDVKSRT